MTGSVDWQSSIGCKATGRLPAKFRPCTISMGAKRLDSQPRRFNCQHPVPPITKSISLPATCCDFAVTVVLLKSDCAGGFRVGVNLPPR